MNLEKKWWGKNAIIERSSIWKTDKVNNAANTVKDGRGGWEKEENKIKMSKLIRENHAYGDMRFIICRIDVDKKEMQNNGR